MTRAPIQDDGGVSALELCDALHRADIELRQILRRLCAGFTSVAEIGAWWQEAEAWAGSVLFDVEWRLWSRGYETPALHFSEDPDGFLLAWATYFAKVRGPAYDDVIAGQSGGHIPPSIRVN